MKLCLRTAALVIAALPGHAQIGVPAFTADRVLPSASARSVPLAPGMLVSIYGTNLGPAGGCVGQVDTKRREIYPLELCGVQVFVGNLAAGLLYVQDKQINFKVPQEVALGGMTDLMVVYQGRSNSAVRVPVGSGKITLSVEGTARVGAPIWIKVDLPYGHGEVHYPASLAPADFGCNQVEVRQNGVLLPRISVPSAPMIYSGPPCRNLATPSHWPEYAGRLPIHLQYRFEKPGLYEMQYTLKKSSFGPAPGEKELQSDWTRLEIFSSQPRPVQPAPSDPTEILSDYLPGILGFADARGLQIVLGYLYHSSDLVRRYAQLALSYWPQQKIDARVAELVRTKGPTDVMVNLLPAPEAGLTDSILSYLDSDDPILLRGAILGVSRALSDSRQPSTAEARTREESALLRAVEHVVGIADAQTRNDFAAALGSVHDARARDVLWSMYARGIAAEQALMAITWHKDLRDLPRLGALLVAPVTGDPSSGELAFVPYALRNSYGDAAVPYLESAIKDSGYVWVRTGCARELVIAGRPAGFAFIADAIEGNRPYKREMVEFVRGRFPEVKAADEGALLGFLKRRAL